MGFGYVCLVFVGRGLILFWFGFLCFLCFTLRFVVSIVSQYLGFLFFLKPSIIFWVFLLLSKVCSVMFHFTSLE